MDNEILSAETAKMFSDSKHFSTEKDLVRKIKEEIIRKIYFGEYSASVDVVTTTPLSIIAKVSKIFSEKGYIALYNTNSITVKWS